MEIIHGMAGTGKSYMLCQLIKKSDENGDDYIVLSPTHAALRNLFERCGDISLTKFKTLCSYFRIDYVRDKVLGPLAKKDIIYIDEFSMVDQHTFKRCLTFVQGSRVIMCGDALQLNAIVKNGEISFSEIRKWEKFSNSHSLSADVLEHLYTSIFSLPIKSMTHLTKFYRFNDKTLKIIDSIYGLTDDIQEEITLPFISFFEVVAKLSTGEYTLIASTYHTLNKFYELVSPKNATVIKNGKSEFSVLRLSENDKLIATVSEDNYYNGQSLVFRSYENDELICDSGVTVKRVDGSFHVIPGNFITVHKSQGRNIPKVIACIDDLFGVSMLYTQITRAMEEIYFYTSDNKGTTIEEAAHSSDFKILREIIEKMSKQRG
jgi:hypothetical protein